MNSKPAFTWEQAKQIADRIIFKHSGEHLKDIEMELLEGSWKGLTYERIGELRFISINYLRGDVGPKLWQKLSDALGEEVTKTNFKGALERAFQAQQPRSSVTDIPSSITPSIAILPFPEGSVELGSPLYIERDGVESLCYETIAKSGSLIRIKAPKLMGKTSLMSRILARGKLLNYRTVYLDLSSVEKGIISNLDKFLRWLCLMVGRQLDLENRLKDYWDTEILGSNDNCTVYFEEYLLPAIDRPLVLGLDDVDRVFRYPEVVEDFLGMLRSWHEKGKIYDRWRQLRLVMAHSTECYISLDLNQSPFNAGVPVELLEFDSKQVLFLACVHGLSWNKSEIEELMKMVGGHPYLLRLALYEVVSGKMTLDRLLRDAATEAGIYSNHLRRHLEVLQHASELAQALKKVIASSEPVELDSMQIYKLHSMGLVQQQDDRVMPRCNLYREYFRRVLSA
jgi:hypothetical protein